MSICVYANPANGSNVKRATSFANTVMPKQVQILVVIFFSLFAEAVSQVGGSHACPTCQKIGFFRCRVAENIADRAKKRKV